MDRIKESDLVIPALTIMSQKLNGFISTSHLIDELEKFFQPQGKDSQILDGRSDTYFSQKVRNLISHRDQPNNFINLGYADYFPDKEGLAITQLGRDHLSSYSS